MKFKASFTDDGISLLDKRFLPAMDKVGRVCHVYFTPTHAMLLHNLLGSTGPDGGGPQCVAQFAKDLLFREYNVSSRDRNRVAFTVDIALLHRALRSALAVQAQSSAAGDAPAAIQVKLVNKQTTWSRSAVQGHWVQRRQAPALLQPPRSLQAARNHKDEASEAHLHPSSGGAVASSSSSAPPHYMIGNTCACKDQPCNL